MQKSKRRFSRVPLGGPVAFSTKGNDAPIRTEGVGKDISLGGMFVETDVPRPPGEPIVVYLTLPGSKREMSLPAVVRWRRGDGMGVQFGLIGARDTHAVLEFAKQSTR